MRGGWAAADLQHPEAVRLAVGLRAGMTPVDLGLFGTFFNGVDTFLQLPLGIADANGDLTVALPAPGFQLRLVGQMQLFAFQTTGLDVATSDSAAFDI